MFDPLKFCTGNLLQDWTGRENTISVGTVDYTMTKQKAAEIVGTTADNISLDPAANQQGNPY
jgi:hypothetical protein